LSTAVPQFNQFFPITIELTYITKKKQTKKGKFMMKCKIDVPVDSKPPAVAASPSVSTLQPTSEKAVPTSLPESNSTPTIDPTIVALKPLDTIIAPTDKVVDVPLPQKPDEKAPIFDPNVQTLVLKVESLEVKDLLDTGTFYDKQDPSITIKVGKTIYSTKRFVLL